MKTFLSAIFLTFSLALSAQNQFVDVMVWDSNYTSIPAYKVWITYYNYNGTGDVNKIVRTDSVWGVYRDVIPASATFDSISFYAMDCHGDMIRGVGTPNLPGTPWGYGDTIFPLCYYPDPRAQPMFKAHQQATPLWSIKFSNLSIPAGTAQAITEYIYDFGDGDSAVNVAHPTHVYSQPGTYWVSLYYKEWDSQTGLLVWEGSYSDSVMVQAAQPAGFCRAQYYIDSTLSGNYTATIYNTSFPHFSDSSFTTTYTWYFGDGDSSNLPYPSHTYDTAGLYNVCLNVYSIDSNGAVCNSTFCDSLGIDSAGNLLYKKSAFTLNVMPDPGMSLNELPAQDILEIYPVPARENLIIATHSAAESSYDYIIYNTYGQKVKQGSLLLKGSISLNISGLSPGAYIFSYRQGNAANYQSRRIIVK